MKLVEEPISLQELEEIAQNNFSELVKAVVDVKKLIMAVDAEMHADQEAFLIEQGSEQENLWGINIYPSKIQDERIEFDSMINIRPWQNNRSRGVDDPDIRKKILEVAQHLISE